MFKLGLIINPIAGIGGRVGLKGSDGEEILSRALALGAKPESGDKAIAALRVLAPLKSEIEIVTCPGAMGEDAARACGFGVSMPADIAPGPTTAKDTMDAAVALREAGAGLILFAGGDGTARNMMDAVGTSVPVLGIPAGCKIHSAVYAVNPKMAGELAARFARGDVGRTREAEVMDIDEGLFRQNVVDARLYGYLKVPDERRMVQNMKSRSFSESGSIAMLSRYVADTLEKDTLYIVAPGSTTRSIMEAAGLPNTLLGVDIFRNREIVANDAGEADILKALDGCPRARIIVTVIGGQGYVFGRGNQQISARVINRVGRENIVVAASKDKMLSLLGRDLYADTGDEATNKTLRGYYKVLVGYGEYVMFRMTD